MVGQVVVSSCIVQGVGLDDPGGPFQLYDSMTTDLVEMGCQVSLLAPFALLSWRCVMENPGLVWENESS